MWKRYEESFSREKKDTKLQYNKKQQQQKRNTLKNISFRVQLSL